MPIKGVTPKCYILSLFVRDDGERFVLGSGYYEFKDKQMHFKANNVANDVIEVQGNDGYLLAGQVRRPGAQEFDGFVGDGTVSKAEVEQKRRAFLAFFRKNHFYKVVYVFSDGTAIQRKRGFLVDDPTVKELYQIYPEYHVALNFEDVNYYSYAEDEDGEEIYSKIAEIQLTQSVATGGLVWDEYGVVWDERQWGGTPASAGGSTSFVVNNQAGKGAPLASVQLNGDTSQQTYSGTNLFNDKTLYSKTISGDVTIIDDNGFTLYDDGTGGGWKFAAFEVSGFTANTNYSMKFNQTNTNPAMTKSWIAIGPGGIINQTYTSGTQVHFNSGENTTLRFLFYAQVGAGSVAENTATVTNVQINVGSSTGAYEPYTNGPAPNPDYPETVNAVTGVQNIKITGKNLLPKNAAGTTTKNDVKFVVDEYGAITVSGTASANTYFNLNKVTLGPGNYVLSGVPSTGSSSSFKIAFNFGGSIQSDFSVNGKTFTLSNTYTASEAFIFIAKDYEAKNIVFKPMIEYGSTKTLYEAYMERTFTVDLGSTKLYKIGAYKDYIYPNNGNWYIHRENGTYTADGTEAVSIASTTPAMIYIPNSEALEGQNNTLMSTHFRYEWANKIGACYVSGSGHKMACGVSGVDTVSAAQSWLSSNHPEFVYILATPTDTKITDATLIGELEAVEATKLYAGENNFLVTASGTNLPAPLDITYYAEVIYPGGAEWSEGAPMGPTTVEVDSIDTVFPVWTVTGPAINPQLSVLTTNTTFKYNGTVSSSQTLVVDMMNKTVLLNGVNMIGNMEGDWASFSPGTNRVVYTTENTDAVASVIEWQEIVG